MTTSDERHAHWQRVWTSRSPDAVSWFEARADQSVELVRELAPAPHDSIIDVGGGASVLVDRLLGFGYEDVTVLDVSAAALDASRSRLGAMAARVRWREGDILSVPLEFGRYDLWHDRAVFHFLTDGMDRQNYVEVLASALRPGGHAVVATFAIDGPEQCSGLPVVRYDTSALGSVLGSRFELLRERRVEHETPAQRSQAFMYSAWRLIDA